jgi:hypothetical protein
MKLAERQKHGRYMRPRNSSITRQSGVQLSAAGAGALTSPPDTTLLPRTNHRRRVAVGQRRVVFVVEVATEEAGRTPFKLVSAVAINERRVLHAMGLYEAETAPGDANPLRLVVIVSEEYADTELDRVEGLGTNALIPSRNENLDIAVGMPAVDRERLLVGVDDPVVSYLVAMIDALLLDEVVALVGRKYFADEVGAHRDRHVVWQRWQVFSSPTRNIRTKYLHFFELDLDLCREPPAPWPAPARTPIIGAKPPREANLRAAVAP